MRNVSVLFFCVINELLKGKEKKPHLQSDDGHDDDGRHRCHTCSRKASQLVYLSHPSLLSISFLFSFFSLIRPIWPCRPVCTSSVGKCIYIKKKDGVLILLWLLEEKKEEDKRILLLCVCLNLLPLHFMARWMISTKRRRRRGWTCLSRLLYTCECTRKTPPTSSSCSACPCDIGLNDTDPI